MTWTRRRLLATGATALAGCSGEPGTTTRGTLDAGETNVRLGFVGDVMLGRSVNDHWEGGDPAGVWGDTLGRLQALDGLVANLECCVSEGGRKWPGKTYYFRADPDFAVPALQAANVSVTSLANNHVLDFQAPALADTRTHLTDAGVGHAGAGPDREAAFEPAVVDVGGLTVATIALTDQLAAYAAGDDGPGTAYAILDPSVPATREAVRSALDRASERDPDLVVATLHWGPNWETAPGKTQEKFAHWLVDEGVDVVHGHSAHVLQGVEVYQGRPIIYDAGDFVDDYIHKDGYHNKRSALFELVVGDGSLDELRLTAIEIEDETATLADAEATEWVQETMQARSEPFGTSFDRTEEGVVVSLGIE